ncbi:MAG: glycosyltransferase [Candidatus Lokiarchaeota archaeon]|nr:glycosyltransferase [Candidatus Lokiarchaeota archaeon]
MSVLEKYEKLIGRKYVKKLREKAFKYQEMRILHINSTKFGGGVAEILQNMIPLMRELTLDAVWETFSAPESFFEVTKKMHNALQGNMEISFSQDEISLYINQAKSTFNQIEPSGDYVIIHDPQPCPIIDEIDEKSGKWIWRCHIDTSNPNPQAWKMIADYLPKYDALIFTKKEYAQPDIRESIFQIPPSIDPFSEKNREISEERAIEIVKKFVEKDKPLITQISRFDPWKDPFGVIDAYRLVKENMDLSLILIGSLAEDDPEGVEYLKKVQDYANSDPDIHIFTNLDGVHDIEVNAFQKVSDVILQKSIKEGFGLTVTEALWKETPVIGGNVGGIKLQIDDGKNGFLVDTVEDCAQKIEYLLKNPKIAQQMGKRGKEKVKEQFLLINHVNNYLNLFGKLL